MDAVRQQHLQSPDSVTSHEAEDINSIPLVMFSSREDMVSENIWPANQLPHLHRAREESRRQGRRPVDLSEKRALHLLSIEARQTSFEDDSDETSPPPSASPDRPAGAGGDGPWEGPSTMEMALAGFRRSSSRRADCCYCHVTIRNWSPTDDAWMRHKHFSPLCRRLKQVGEGGIHPSPEGKRQLRHSFSSIHDIKRPA